MLGHWFYPMTSCKISGEMGCWEMHDFSTPSDPISHGSLDKNKTHADPANNLTSPGHPGDVRFWSVWRQFWTSYLPNFVDTFFRSLDVRSWCQFGCQGDVPGTSELYFRIWHSLTSPGCPGDFSSYVSGLVWGRHEKFQVWSESDIYKKFLISPGCPGDVRTLVWRP